MFLSGMDLIKFSYLLNIDIPHEWTEHAEQQACMLADQAGKKREDMEVFVCLAAPECPESLAYQYWQRGLEHSLALQCVPICIVCASTFDQDFGHRATERFMVSMRTKGRPHHFQRLGFPKQ